MNTSKKVLKITGPALFRINSVIVSARTVNVSDGSLVGKMHLRRLGWHLCRAIDPKRLQFQNTTS